MEKIDAAMDFYRTMLFEDALFKLRLGLFYLSERLSTAVAYLNGTYLDDWRAGNLAQLKRLRELPASYLEVCQAVVTMEQASPEEIRCLAYRMLQTVRAFAFQKAPEGQEKLSAPSLAGLADWYQEMSLTWRRLRYYCGVQNSELALWHACYLQSELLVVGEEFSLGELDLLGSYDSRDLVPLRERSVELERQIISTLENAGVPIRQYESVGDFFART